MVANDFQHRAIGKSLFVVAEFLRNIDTGEYCRLPGRTLRPAFNSERGVSRNNYPLERDFRNLAAEDRQGFDIGEAIERIRRPARTNPQAVNEEEQD